jgi:large subunit ribosomal protein L13
MSHARFARPLWHLVDAKNQVVGRLASQVTRILLGKHKPTFSPNYDCGDYVVIINAAEVKFTGNKLKQKEYIWHTGWPGGLKRKTAERYLESKPEEVLRKAILGMMAKNTIRKMAARKLRIFPTKKHLHEDMLPPGTMPINQAPNTVHRIC